MTERSNIARGKAPHGLSDEKKRYNTKITPILTPLLYPVQEVNHAERAIAILVESQSNFLTIQCTENREVDTNIGGQHGIDRLSERSIILGEPVGKNS